MNGLDNSSYVVGLIISNVTAILFMITAMYKPKVTRVLFFLLFSWACWMNWTLSHQEPSKYLEYAELTFSDFYKDVINGWFSWHISFVVGLIAIGQGLIGISMLLKGWIFRTGATGGIIFLLAIAPLGVGSGFPSTIIFAIAMYGLVKEEGKEYIWTMHKAIRA